MPVSPDIRNIPDVIRFAIKSKPADWQEDYWEKVRRAVQTHTRGYLFEKVDTLYPNEHPSSKEHCLSAYEPITSASIWKGINNISRIFRNSSFSINTGVNSEEFIQQHAFEGRNLFNFFVEEWVNVAIANDPNALIAVYPPDYAEATDINMIQFIGSEHRIHLDKDICVFISEKESEKDYSFEPTRTATKVFYDKELRGPNSITSTEKSYNQRVEVKIRRKVFHIFTKEYFMRVTEGDNGEYPYEIYRYPKAVEMLPVFIAGGVKIERGVYDTFVAPFIPYGNLALIQHRQHTAVNLTFSFPRISEIETVCGECNLGYVRCEKTEENPDGRKACSNCNGTGFTTNQSPYKTYKRRLDPSSFESGAATKNPADIDDVKYYTPDVSILDYSKNEWKGYLSMGEEAIFIQQKQDTGNIESAKSKEIDREAQYAWLNNISRVLFDRIRMTVQAVENYVASSPVEVTVESPYSYAILTEQEAFLALNEIINSQAPIFLKSQQVENFTGKFVSKNSPVIKSLNILKRVDPFLFYSQTDMESFKSNSAISVEQWQYHILAYPVLMQMFAEDPNLFDQEENKIVEGLKTRIDEMLPEEEQDLATRVQQRMAQNGDAPVIEDELDTEDIEEQ